MYRAALGTTRQLSEGHTDPVNLARPSLSVDRASVEGGNPQSEALISSHFIKCLHSSFRNLYQKYFKLKLENSVRQVIHYLWIVKCLKYICVWYALRSSRVLSSLPMAFSIFSETSFAFSTQHFVRLTTFVGDLLQTHRQYYLLTGSVPYCFNISPFCLQQEF